MGEVGVTPVFFTEIQCVTVGGFMTVETYQKKCARLNIHIPAIDEYFG